MEAIQSALKRVIKEVFETDLQPELTRTDEQFGDYATNVAMQLAGRLKRAPREIADQLASALREALGEQAQEVAIAGPGFINIRLSNKAVVEQVADALQKPQPFKDEIVVAEYSDPNPFKILHAGHLYTSVVGDAIANLMQAGGGTVHRVNFGGDVGLHVGKTMWGMIQDIGGEYPEKLAEKPESDRPGWLSACYVRGNTAFEEDEQAKAEIVALNKRVYKLHDEQDHESPFAQMYWTCRQWSYDWFNAFYARIGTKFEKYYPESVCAPVGLKVVQEQLAKGVFTESDGAIIFEGDKHDLHTRVFINSQGIPTYEAKDIGLVMLKKQDFHFDRSIIITDNGQEQYMAVVLKALEQFEPELAHATTHLTHGIVKLQGGVKMSSRKGNGLRATDVLDIAAEANHEATGRDDELAVLGAVKYAFLKTRIGGDIIYDPKESVSLQGNSGPYLQYAHARARSILAKAKDATPTVPADLQPDERSLARKIGEYPEVVAQAMREFMPHHVCTYLYELAQVFNRFYEHNRVVGDPRAQSRLYLVRQYAEVLEDGLTLLGVPAPERM